MLSSVPARQDAHDDYVKQLLDQRTVRADFYGRFSTASDYSDSPSVYSRSFSPRPEEKREPTIVTGYTPSSHDHLFSNDDLASNSPLDPGADSGSSYASHITFTDTNHEEEGDEGSTSHMSVLGPKMRFHSRAPWETEEGETVSEVDRANRTKPKFFNFGPSSPRFSKLSRPSVESTRSEVASKAPVDSVVSKGLHSRGIIYAQHQGNLSNTSLGHACGGDRQDSVRGFSSGCSGQSPTSTQSSPDNTFSSNPPRSSDANSTQMKHSPLGFDCHRDSADNTRMFLESPASFDLQEVHPYANPDLAVYTPEPIEFPMSSVDIVSSDSTATITQSSAASSVLTSATASTQTPGISTSALGVPRKSSASALHGRQISTPVAVVGRNLRSNKSQRSEAPLLLPGVQNLPGWMDKTNTPSLSLISLEEARAQRARSVTQPTLANESSSLSLTEDTLSFSEHTDFVQDGLSSQQTSAIHRTRTRSVSASTKASSASHSVEGTQHQPDKRESVKRKKSGFMRLLTGSRTQVREERTQPPPVPVLPDVYTSYNQQTSNQKLHRIPVPEIASEVANPHDNVRLAETALNPRRALPPLSIGTSVLNNTLHVPASVSPRSQSVLVDSSEKSCKLNDMPHSAPAHVVDFPALQLRPVSTLFSPQFVEHLTERPVEEDTEILYSSSTEAKAQASSVIEPVDQSAVISALQDRMVSAKVAWQRQIWELEGQIRDLRAEVEGLRATARRGSCDACGRGKPHNGDPPPSIAYQTTASVVNRPRARTGPSARFGSSIA